MSDGEREDERKQTETRLLNIGIFIINIVSCIENVRLHKQIVHSMLGNNTIKYTYFDIAENA